MQPSDKSTAVAGVNLTPAEQRLVRGMGAYRRTLLFASLLLVAICMVWFKHFDRFISNPFFLTYNLIVYVALIWAAFSTARYQWRVHRLLERLRHGNNSVSSSGAPNV